MQDLKNRQNSTKTDNLALLSWWENYQHSVANKAKEAYEDDLANKLLLLSIIKNYKLKKSILEQKIKNATDSNEARDFILNSEEWKEIEQYEKWAKELLHRQ
jgi:hypothetical protein